MHVSRKKNHKIAEKFLTYLKLILGTEKVYSWKKQANQKKKERKTNQVKTKNRWHMQRKNDLVSIYHIIISECPLLTNQNTERNHTQKNSEHMTYSEKKYKWKETISEKDVLADKLVKDFNLYGVI